MYLNSGTTHDQRHDVLSRGGGGVNEIQYHREYHLEGQLTSYVSYRPLSIIDRLIAEVQIYFIGGKRRFDANFKMVHEQRSLKATRMPSCEGQYRVLM